MTPPSTSEFDQLLSNIYKPHIFSNALKLWLIFLLFSFSFYLMIYIAGNIRICLKYSKWSHGFSMSWHLLYLTYVIQFYLKYTYKTPSLQCFLAVPLGWKQNSRTSIFVNVFVFQTGISSVTTNTVLGTMITSLGMWTWVSFAPRWGVTKFMSTFRPLSTDLA